MRRPLAWLIAFEILLVAALAAATYHVLAARASPAPAVAAAPAPAPPKNNATRPLAPSRTPLPQPSPSARPTGPAPGLSFDPAFWTGQLQRVNHDQHALEQLQWQVTSAVTDWVRAYVKRVLLPAVWEAEKK